MSDPKDIAIGISLSVQVGDGRTLVMQTACALDDPKQTRDGVLDALRLMADRQVKFGLLDALQNNIAENERLKNQTLRALKDVDAIVQQRAESAKAAGRNPKEIPPAEKAQRENAVRNVKHHEDVIAELTAKAEDLRSSLE